MVTSLEDGRSAPGAASGTKWPTSLRCERIGEIDQAQALGEPGERNDRAGEALGRLMTAGHRRLRAAVADQGQAPEKSRSEPAAFPG